MKCFTLHDPKFTCLASPPVCIFSEKQQYALLLGRKEQPYFQILIT